MTTPLTQQQERLWLYIKGCERSPSFRQMMDALGLKSTSGVARLVDGLEKKGYLTTVGQTRGGYRMARCLVANDGPRPMLSGYSSEELIDELFKRNREALAA
jgi:SOS-response transcriptional repressor LexA